MRQVIEQSVEDLRGVIDDIRSYVMALPLERLGSTLPSLLDGLVQDWRDFSNADVKITMPPELPALTEPQTVAIYHVAREALSNARKHAHAHQLELRLQSAEGILVLEVEDDGVGFDSGTAQAVGHLGLGNMQIRADQVDGSLSVVSASGSGTLVRLSLPVTV
jgi:signal transduction histidine kinase